MSVNNPNIMERLKSIEKRLDSLEKRVSNLEKLLKRNKSSPPNRPPFKPGKGPEPFKF